jgi:nitrite reductase/ring-hydroxylating ferredoxin subunit
VSETALCTLDDLTDPGSKGVIVELGGAATEIFLVRRGNEVYAYHNTCPHKGTPLDWMPDEFLDDEREHIVCATHGAVFRVEDGLCIAGPCRHQSLRPVAIELRDGRIYLAPA